MDEFQETEERAVASGVAGAVPAAARPFPDLAAQRALLEAYSWKRKPAQGLSNLPKGHTARKR